MEICTIIIQMRQPTFFHSFFFSVCNIVFFVHTLVVPNLFHAEKLKLKLYSTKKNTKKYITHKHRNVKQKEWIRKLFRIVLIRFCTFKLANLQQTNNKRVIFFIFYFAILCLSVGGEINFFHTINVHIPTYIFIKFSGSQTCSCL